MLIRFKYLAKYFHSYDIYIYIPTTRPNNKRAGDITGLVLWHPVLNIVNELCYR